MNTILFAVFKLLNVPFVTAISLLVKPITASLNVNVTGIGDIFVAEPDDDILTLGDSVSYTTSN